jgi:hypothetical protein
MNKPVLVERGHPDDLADPARSGRAMRSVTVNLRESPLGWLHAHGRIDDRQLLAGERLRGDYERSGLGASVTMRWDAAPIVRGGRSPSVAGLNLTERGIEARRRFHAAMDHVGPGLADICWRVICAGEAMSGAEKTLGWPARSGRLVLTLALDRLVRFYGV